MPDEGNTFDLVAVFSERPGAHVARFVTQTKVETWCGVTGEPIARAYIENMRTIWSPWAWCPFCSDETRYADRNVAIWERAEQDRKDERRRRQIEAIDRERRLQAKARRPTPTKPLSASDERHIREQRELKRLHEAQAERRPELIPIDRLAHDAWCGYSQWDQLAGAYAYDTLERMNDPPPPQPHEQQRFIPGVKSESAWIPHGWTA